MHSARCNRLAWNLLYWVDGCARWKNTPATSLQGRYCEGAAVVFSTSRNPRFPRQTRIAVYNDARQHDGTLPAGKLVPPKIRELIADLQTVAFLDRGGRGSHRNNVHPRMRKPVTISGDLGDDAKPYQVRAARLAIWESQQ